MPTLYDNFERVRQYIDQHQADVDLSSYVSYSYLESKHYLTEHQDLSSYVTKTDLSNAGYVTSGEISQMGYITSVPSEYITQDELSANSYLTEHQSLNAYVLAPIAVTDPTEPYRMYTTGLGANNNTKQFYPTALTYNAAVNTNNNAWASVGTVRNYVDGRLAEIEASYVTSSDLPVIDENIIPKETGTYTLGDSSHIYSSAYTQNVKGVQRIFFPNGSSLAINNTAGNASSDRYTFSSSEFKPNATGNISLGSSTAKWGATYTANLYADTIHNFIWTGTSAEYAALDNYTSYQIYMIKEA